MKKLIAFLCLLLPITAFAANSMTFTSSVTNANGSLQTKLTWTSTPAATDCVASGDPKWTGSKGPSGSLDLPPITIHGTYSLALTCSWAGDDKAMLTWTPPTQNTDGSTLTDLAGFRIYYGTSAGSLTQTVNVPSAGTTTYTLTGLAPATYFFGVSALNASGVESALSSLVSKTTTAGTSASQTVKLTVNPVPNPATGLQVQ